MSVKRPFACSVAGYVYKINVKKIETQQTESCSKRKTFLFYNILNLELLASDQPCTAIGGTCQDNSNKCRGSYFSGKCSGSTHRRCCTRTAIGE
jgi:hypothetical protein